MRAVTDRLNSANVFSKAEIRSELVSDWSREWLYFTFVVATWCFVSVIRRYLDWKSGAFNSLSILSLVPYLTLIPLAYIGTRPIRLRRIGRPLKVLALMWIASFSYALLVGIAAGNTSAALFSFTQYVLPMSVGIWLAGQPLELAVAFRRVTFILCTFGAIVAIYGLAQYVSPSPWDVFWVLTSHWVSSGLPEPYTLRIFSTLNSTGPCGDFLALAILLSLRFFRLRNAWILLVASALAAALMLTLVRASWIGLVFGTIIYLILSPRRFLALPVFATFVVVLVFTITALPTFLGADSKGTAIVDRLNTFNDVHGDASAVARQGEIGDTAEQSAQNPIGDGLGTLGASARLSANADSALGNNLDSGYLGRLIEMGWIGFSGYCFVLFGGIITIVNAPNALGRTKDQEFCLTVATAAALAGALIWLDAAGDSHYGLDALFFWIAMSVCGAPASSTLRFRELRYARSRRPS